MDKEALQKEAATLRKEVTILGIRLTLAQAWIDFFRHAYDALLTHGVNYRTLPEYKDSTELDDAQDLPVQAGREKIITWIGRLKNAVSAAVRRKGFRQV